MHAVDQVHVRPTRLAEQPARPRRRGAGVGVARPVALAEVGLGLDDAEDQLFVAAARVESADDVVSEEGAGDLVGGAMVEGGVEGAVWVHGGDRISGRRRIEPSRCRPPVR